MTLPAQSKRAVRVCTGCGGHTAEWSIQRGRYVDVACTAEECAEEFWWVYEPDFDGDGEAWFCEMCQ